MAKIKSKLTEEEKNKVNSLTSLSTNAGKKSSTKSEAPVNYTKVSEQSAPESYSDALKATADDYFASLLEREEKDDGGVTKATVTTTPHLTISSEGTKETDNIKEESQSAPKATTVEELFSQMDSITKSYADKSDRDYYEHLLPVIKESLGLEKLDNVEIDEDKIKNEVESLLKSQYDAKKSQAEESTNRQIQSEQQSKADLVDQYAQNKDEINKIYDEAKIVSSNESLKRGLSRSSIALLSIDGLEEQKAQELVNLSKSLASALSESEAKIEELKNELQSSLENLDIEYAIELNEEIKKEVEDLYEKQQEVIKFNNNVDKLEADYQAKRADLQKESMALEEDLAKEYSGTVARQKESELKEVVNDYLSGMDKAEAIKLLASDPRFFEYLGTAFYDIYYKIMRS